LRGFDVRLRVGLAALHVGGGDQVFREGEAGGADADLS
jgi:hypothetical protein